MVNTSAKNFEWRALDGWRAFAAISVFIVHFEELVIKKFVTVLGIPIHKIWQAGIGVDLFFVLSGLLLFVSANKALRDKNGNILLSKQTLLSFWKRRWLRIAPLYYFSMCILLVFSVPIYLLIKSGWLNIALHLTFLHSFWFESHGAINGVYWTLSLEFLFYLLVPFLIWAKQKPWGKIVFPSLLLLTWVYRYIVFTFYFPTTDNGAFEMIVIDQLFGRLDQFVVGMLIGEWLLKGKTNTKAQTYGLAVVGLLLLFLTTSFTWFSPTSVYKNVFSAVSWHTTYAVGIGFLILSTVQGYKYFLTKFFELPLFFWLSQLSYGMYIWHLVVIRSLLTVTDSIWKVGLMSCVVVFGLSITTYFLIERPFWKRQT